MAATARVLAALLAFLPIAARADDGAWLERAAEQAVVAGQLPRAVTLLRGLSALRPRDPSPTYRLAEVYALAGQYEEAVVEYRRFAARAEADGARKAHAENEAKRLEEAPAPFAEAVFRPQPATVEAKRLFEAGRKSAQQKHDHQAIGELEAALLLDPDLPGPYRLLGAVHTRTGDAAEAHRFLAEYLRVRPDGKIAETVRGELKKAGLLGTVTLESSWPCRVFVNGRDTGRSTPLVGYTLPAGRYTLGLENENLHVVRLLRVEVAAGKDTKRRFDFGVLVTKLDPWARVVVDGKDVGLWDEMGVPEGKHRVKYKAHDGSREKTVEVEIKAGTRTHLSW
jgi:tetratricopeptide (TPR) repeat protein